MYVIYNTQTLEVLATDKHIVHPANPPVAERVYRDFDAGTMTMAPCHSNSLPTHWIIQDNGTLIGVRVSDMVVSEQWPLEHCQTALKEYYSERAFVLRKVILPDYKVNNAGIGVYDEATQTSYKDTVEAFRTEYYRLETAIEAAATYAELDAIEASFPTELVS